FIAYIAASLDAQKLSACKNWLPELKKLWLEKYDGYAVIGGRYYCLLLAYQYLESGPSIKSTVVKEVEDFLIKQESILEEGGEARAIKYLLVVVFFSRRDFSRAWDYCQSILNSSATAPRKELFDATRLLFLLVLVESKKLEELEYYCRQLEGFVRKKEKKEYLLERTLVKHFKQLSNPLLSSKEQQVILGDLNSALKKIETMNNLCAKQLTHYFDFRGWVQERMERLTNK
ncbi:MAG TPA: hypothetical protein PLD84_06430, partial [Chitinophagales bacterium]|nr:hypothetical protein [Chitinophagales bacterium]